MAKTTCIIVHHDTPDLLVDCITSLRRHYPYLPLLVVDSGSELTSSIETLEDLETYPYNEVLYHPSNLGHGPGMHIGILAVDTVFVLTMDSDCLVITGGWLEQMESKLSEPFVYACGRVVPINSRGRREEGGAPYCHPVTAIWNRTIYLNFPPFEAHGSPCLRNQLYAASYGWQVANYPVEDYVQHLGKGTRGRYGAKWVQRDEVIVE